MKILGKKFDTAVFPGYQGGPLMHIIAAKAAGFFEALKPEFQTYIKNVLANAKMLAETLKNNGFKIYSGGTDTHLMLVDLRPFNVKGNIALKVYVEPILLVIKMESLLIQKNQ